MAGKDEFYALSTATGATTRDSAIDIDGGFGTLLSYASKGTRELPNDTIYLDGNPEPIGRKGTFLGQHIYTSRPGVAVQINAFNFPVWGMLEKLAPAFLAGIPSIVKPASQTAYLTELVFRRIIESGLLPEGSVQLLCGSPVGLLDDLDCQDMVGIHRLGRNRCNAASASKCRRARPPLQRGSRFIELLHSRAGRDTGYSRIRSLRKATRGRDDHQGRPEVHRDSARTGAPRTGR